MQIYELTYCNKISAKVTLSTQVERELSRDCEVEHAQEIDENLASEYLEEVACTINEMIKLPKKFKAANGCRVEINSTTTEQA